MHQLSWSTILIWLLTKHRLFDHHTVGFAQGWLNIVLARLASCPILKVRLRRTRTLVGTKQSQATYTRRHYADMILPAQNNPLRNFFHCTCTIPVAHHACKKVAISKPSVILLHFWQRKCAECNKFITFTGPQGCFR